MDTLHQYLTIFLCVTLGAAFVIWRIISRCKKLTYDWIEKNGITVKSNNISINFLTNPLQATVLGIANDGIKKKYTLQVYRKRQWEKFREAKLLHVESIDE